MLGGACLAQRDAVFFDDETQLCIHFKHDEITVNRALHRATREARNDRR
jgi:hypothetical protein